MRFKLDPTAPNGVSTGAGTTIIQEVTSGNSTPAEPTPDAELSYHDAWASVQKSVHFRADEISTLNTNAERIVMGAAYPDWNIGFVTISGTVYAFGVDGAASVGSMITRTVCTVGDTLSINGSPTVCSVTGQPGALDYIGGGPLYLDGSRLVMFAHTEDGPTLSGAVITSTDNGLNWTYVGTVFGSTYEIQAFVFDPTNDNIYYYLNGNSTTIIAKTTKTAMTAYAAGGASPTVTYWDGTAWVSGEGNAVSLADDTSFLPTVSDVMYVPQVNKYFAVAHKGGTVDPYELSGYVIDVDEPWNLKKLDVSLYRDPADRQNADGDEPSNIGYVSLVAPDRQAVATNAFIDLIRVDAEDPDPGQPWDNTILTQVRLRPTVDKRDVVPIELDRVVRVTGGFTGTSALEHPSYTAVTLSDNDDVMAYDLGSSDGWRRYIVQSSGDWIIHPEQPGGNDLLQAPTAVDGVDVQMTYNIYLNPSTGLPDLDRSVNPVNQTWNTKLISINTPVFIFDPDGTAGGKIYTDFDAMYQIMSLNAGQKSVQVVPPNSGQKIFINGLTNTSLNFDGVNISGAGGTGGAEIQLIFGDNNTSEQITITSWENGSISNGIVIKNNCPSYLGQLSVLPKLQGQGFLSGIRAPVFKLTGFFDALLLDGGGVTTEPKYPVGFAGISGGSWDAGSGGLLTITFGSDHQITSEYIGANFYIRDADPATYDGTREIYDIPSASTIRLVEPSDPGAFVSGGNESGGGGTWVVGEPAVEFSDDLGAPQYHIIAYSGDRPLVARDSLRLEAGALVIQVLNSASADRTGSLTQFQNSGTLVPPEGAGLVFANSSNLKGMVGGTVATSYYVDGQIEDLDTEIVGKVAKAGDTMTGTLVLAAGTTSIEPVQFQAGSLLSSPALGALEFANNRLYVTNVATQRAIDRTSDVITSTATVTNTTTETTLWTGTIGANDLKAGNVLKIFTSGIITNATAADDITINVYIGSTLVETYNPAIGNVTNADWHTNTQIVVRSVGGSGSLAVHGEVHINGNTQFDNSIQTIDTTTNENITVKAQWDNAKLGNTISIYQGHLEFKN